MANHREDHIHVLPCCMKVWKRCTLFFDKQRHLHLTRVHVRLKASMKKANRTFEVIQWAFTDLFTCRPSIIWGAVDVPYIPDSTHESVFSMNVPCNLSHKRLCGTLQFSKSLFLCSQTLTLATCHVYRSMSRVISVQNWWWSETTRNYAGPPEHSYTVVLWTTKISSPNQNHNMPQRYNQSSQLTGTIPETQDH